MGVAGVKARELYLLPYVMSNMPKASRIAGEPSLVLGQLNGDE